MFGVLCHSKIPVGDEYYETNALTFCLGGEYRECSMAELAWRMGLYDQSGIMTEAFGELIDSFHNVFCPR